jgi:hypothetical protein
MTVMVKFDPGFKQAESTSGLPADMYGLEGGMRCGEMTFVKGTTTGPGGSKFGPIDRPEAID